MPSLSDPIVQVLLPLAAAFLAAFALRRLGGPRVVPLAIAIAFLAGYVVVLGVPPYPPRSAGQKVAYVAGGLALLGLLADLAGGSPVLRRLAASAGWTAAAAWIAQARLTGGLGPDLLLPGVVWLSGLAALWAVDRVQGVGIRAPAALLAAAVGVAGVALVSASASIAQLGFALQAAIGGYLLWNWPRVRDGFGATGLLAAGGTALALILQMALFTKAPWPALALVGLAFAAALLPVGESGGGRTGGGWRGALGGVLHLACALVPAIAAIGLAHFLVNR